MSIAQKRLEQEKENFRANVETHISEPDVSADLLKWRVALSFDSRCRCFAGHRYILLFIIPPNYPIAPPAVYFEGQGPRWNHTHGNGTICLDLLNTNGNGWSPALTIASLCKSIFTLMETGE